MEFTPDTSPSKRGRAKFKAVAGSAETKPAAAKKPRAPRKTLTTKAAPAAEVEIMAATPDPTPQDPTPQDPRSEDLGTMIATAAYYLAAARNFSPGHELDDWLEAERAIHARLNG